MQRAQRVEGVNIATLKYHIKLEKVTPLVVAPAQQANFIPGSPFSPRQMIVANILPNHTPTLRKLEMQSLSDSESLADATTPTTTTHHHHNTTQRHVAVIKGGGRSDDSEEGSPYEDTSPSDEEKEKELYDDEDQEDNDEEHEEEEREVEQLGVHVFFQELCNAIREERTDKVVELLDGSYSDWGQHPDYADWVQLAMHMEDEWYGESLLHLAASNGVDSQVLNLLIDKGADVLARDKHGNRYPYCLFSSCHRCSCCVTLRCVVLYAVVVVLLCSEVHCGCRVV